MAESKSALTWFDEKFSFFIPRDWLKEFDKLSTVRWLTSLRARSNLASILLRLFSLSRSSSSSSSTTSSSTSSLWAWRTDLRKSTISLKNINKKPVNLMRKVLSRKCKKSVNCAELLTVSLGQIRWVVEFLTQRNKISLVLSPKWI